jgi:RNA polymerase sigma factor (sigma-70 family)
VDIVLRSDFSTWYRAEHPRLVATMTAVCRDASVGRDVADEACARVLERWERVRQMESPGGWAYHVALNVARRRARRGRSERERLEGLAATPTADDGWWSIEVRDAFERLPPRERTAVLLRYVADLSQADVAAAMKVAPGTVAAALNSARQKLRVYLGDETTGGKEVRHG